MIYGKLIVTFELSKEETRKLEDLLTKSRRVALTRVVDFAHPFVVNVDDIEVSEVGGNVQFLTVKGTS